MLLDLFDRKHGPHVNDQSEGEENEKKEKRKTNVQNLDVFFHFSPSRTFPLFAALVAVGGHDSDVEVSGSGENSERYLDHGADDTGARRMREAAIGDFRRANRFPRGRGTGGHSAGENALRLSLSTRLRRGEELRVRLFQFGLGLFGACHASGTRRGASARVQTRRPSQASRVPKPERNQNQDGSVARFEGRLSRALPSQGGCPYVLNPSPFPSCIVRGEQRWKRKCTSATRLRHWLLQFPRVPRRSLEFPKGNWNYICTPSYVTETRRTLYPQNRVLA